MKLIGSKCILTFDCTGRAVKFENLLTGESYSLADGGEYIVSDGIKYESDVLTDTRETGTGLEFIYDNFRVKWESRGAYFEKTVTFTAPAEMLIDRAGVLDFSFPEAKEVYFCDDRSLWHVPLCDFARYEKGGVYYGLEYPYWDDEKKMSFSPWVTVNAGEEFVCEKAFIGTFAYTGRKVVSHGAYPGKRRFKYQDVLKFEETGLNQHMADGQSPEDVGIADAELDYGEICAMREFFRGYLGQWPLPEEGYFIWQNGWWAGLSTPDPACLDVIEKAGVKDMITAAMYFGHAGHPSTEPEYITDVRIDPLGFPAVKKEAEVKTLADGHHNVLERGEGRAEETEYTDTFSAPENYDKLVKLGKERGIHVTSFSTPNNAYRSRPDWVSVDKDGEPYHYLGTRLSCPACREYMEHHFKVLTSVLDKYKPRYWGFDGRWMNYQEFAGYGYGYIGEAPCYGENHGHLPGKGRYMEWKNIEDFKRRLRERYPDMCVEQYYGMKRGGTWGLTYINADENYYEVSCADNCRFQAWHNENDRFRPANRNFANIFSGEEEEFEYNVISAISISRYCQLASGYHSLKDSDRCVEIFRRWKAWASENVRYFDDRQTLFGSPGDVPVDGCARIDGGEGWVFLFNVTEEDQTARIDLSEIIGLDGDSYGAELIHPEVKKYEAVPAGGAFCLSMKPRSAAVLKLYKA